MKEYLIDIVGCVRVLAIVFCAIFGSDFVEETIGMLQNIKHTRWPYYKT